MKKHYDFECNYCGYWWKDANEKYERCHCPPNEVFAPCEYDDYYVEEPEQEDYSELIFNVDE